MYARISKKHAIATRSHALHTALCLHSVHGQHALLRVVLARSGAAAQSFQPLSMVATFVHTFRRAAHAIHTAAQLMPRPFLGHSGLHAQRPVVSMARKLAPATLWLPNAAARSFALRPLAPLQQHALPAKREINAHRSPAHARFTALYPPSASGLHAPSRVA